jgi:hypothetical protein
MNREPDTPRPQAGPAGQTGPESGKAGGKEGRKTEREAQPGPHSPPPARTDADGPESGGYERGQHDSAPTNRKGGYGAG